MLVLLLPVAAMGAASAAGSATMVPKMLLADTVAVGLLMALVSGALISESAMVVVGYGGDSRSDEKMVNHSPNVRSLKMLVAVQILLN